MVNDSSERLDTVFLALADPTRRAILERLAHGEASGTELARPFSISVPAISKHLRVLEHADLILHRKDGRTHRFRLAARPMKEAADWLEQYRQFWEEHRSLVLRRFHLDGSPGPTLHAWRLCSSATICLFL